jgi:hypothetical protein
MQDCEICAEDDLMAQARARTAFLAAKGKVLTPEAEKQYLSMEDEVALTYAEFIEALVRVGVAKFDDPRLSLAEKMLHTARLVVAQA